MHLILGSQSPRRQEILSHFKIPFEQISSSFSEDSIPFKDNPATYALEIAKGKAKDLHRHFPHAAILTADTVVYFNGKSFGKPKDVSEAAFFLKELSGEWHSVFTGVYLIFGHEYYSGFEETRILFNCLTNEQIQSYLSKVHYLDKAGAYSAQLPGSLIVKKIDGCFYNVMGLPINTVRHLLLKIGIDLWYNIN